ncbi:unnamed protein product, partial [Dovyalis caffra]
MDKKRTKGRDDRRKREKGAKLLDSLSIDLVGSPANFHNGQSIFQLGFRALGKVLDKNKLEHR